MGSVDWFVPEDKSSHEQLITVVIPLYNKEAEIKETLKSVLCQTYSPFEVLVVNDGSTDCSEDLVNSFEAPNLRLINQSNQGVSVARNTGIAEAKTEWVALIDGDDIWAPTHLENLVKLLKCYPGSELYSTRITPDKDRLGTKKECVRIKDYSKYVLDEGWAVNSSSLMFTKRIWRLVGGFPQGETHGEDIVTWYKMSFYTDICVSDKVDVLYRNDCSNNASRSIKDEDDAFVKYMDLRVIEGPEDVRFDEIEISNKMRISKAFFLISSGAGWAAKKHLDKAVSTKRFKKIRIACMIACYLPPFLAKAIAQSVLKCKS
tara:strand:+ start:6582 stop:7535 length:954 start_codon:yes stop_codon:yes gene_type:complete